jgi:hypothetical protein
MPRFGDAWTAVAGGRDGDSVAQAFVGTLACCAEAVKVYGPATGVPRGTKRYPEKAVKLPERPLFASRKIACEAQFPKQHPA